MTAKKCTECETKYEDVESSNPGHCPNCDSMYWALESMEVSQSIPSKKTRIGDVRSDFSIYTPGKSEQSTERNAEQVVETTDTDRLIAAQNKNTQDLIRAQNKTTHAVRAFVRFLFIQLSGLTLVYFTWNLSAISIDPNECARYGDKCEGNLFFQVLAILIWIGTVIFSSRAGWSELEKSDI